MSSVEVCPTSELRPGDRVIVDTDRGEIGVFNVDGEYYAMKNVCPHRQGPVCEGKVSGALVGRWDGVGSRVIERYDDDPAVSCPWHGWDFYLGSGEHVGESDIRVATYPVSVEDGTVYLDV